MIFSLAQLSDGSTGESVAVSAVIFIFATAAIWLAMPWAASFIARQERQWSDVVRGGLLLDLSPRSITVLSAIAIVVLAAMGYLFTGGLFGAAVFGAFGAAFPTLLLRVLRRRRLAKLEEQLVGGIQTLSSGVRAGLNFVQAMQLVARDGPSPIRQEFAHLLREYEYGVPLEEATENSRR